jgi:hypothetical protein
MLLLLLLPAEPPAACCPADQHMAVVPIAHSCPLNNSTSTTGLKT